MRNLHGLRIVGQRRDLPVKSRIGAFETAVEKAFLEHDAAIGIGLGGRDHAVEIDLKRRVEIVLARRS